MEEDLIISNITIGNSISKPKKSAFDKKKEKKMRYLEKKQFKRQYKKNNDKNLEKKIFKNEPYRPKRINKEENIIKNKVDNEKLKLEENNLEKTNQIENINVKNAKERDNIIDKIKYENNKEKNDNKNDIKIENDNNNENQKNKKILKIDEDYIIDKEMKKDEMNNSIIDNEIIKNEDKIIKKEPEDDKKEIREDKIIDNNKNNISFKETKKNNSQTIFSVKTFDDLKINQYLKKALNKNNYNTMTKIQKKAIPILLEHKNVIVKSETGSGKTLAYIIPLYQNLIEINEINKISRKDGIYSIIFSPTHELCLQIEKTFDKLKSSCINVVYGTMMGGQKIDTEKKKLRKGINVIITTPGRLLYHLRNSGNLNFSKLKMIIIDEADLMLDMGFEKDIKECFKLIIKKSENENEFYNDEDIELNPDLFKKYKIYLISATIDNRIRKMSNYFMKGFKAIGFEKEDNDNEKKEDIEKNKNDKKIDNAENMEKNIDNENDKYNIIKHNSYLSSLKQQNITQFYSCIYDEYKLIHLIAFLYNNINKKTIIFVSTCDLCEYLSKLIIEIDIDINYNNNSTSSKNIKDKSKSNTKEKLINLFSQKTYKLHGKMKHEERKIVFNEFNEDSTGILIATDVASRGLDFKEVDWIIHYDINPDIKEYVNRIGRTARIDNIGNSILFLMKNEMKLLDTCFISVKNNLNEIKSDEILINFLKEINKNILEKKLEENINLNKIEEEEALDENEIYRKKYGNILNILIRCIKNFVFKDKSNLIMARKAFKSEIRAYATFFKYGKDVFNVNILNLTRISRSFGLYKESLSMKVGDEQVNINYQTDRKEKFTQKKFLNKKIQNKLIYSEFE